VGFSRANLIAAPSAADNTIVPSDAACTIRARDRMFWKRASCAITSDGHAMRVPIRGGYTVRADPFRT
jgi:hypothetical protein